MRPERRRRGRAIRKSRRIWRDTENAFAALGKAAEKATYHFTRLVETIAESNASAHASYTTALGLLEAPAGDPTYSGVTRGTRAPVACERTSPEGGF